MALARKAPFALVCIEAFESVCPQMQEAVRMWYEEEREAVRQELEKPGQVVLLAGSNAPWDIDKGVLDRLEVHMLLPRPDAASRRAWVDRRLAPRFFPRIRKRGSG